MKLNLYIDTSVIGGCFDDEFSEISLKLIDEFKNGNKVLNISDLTLSELEDAPSEVRKVLEQIPDEYKEYLYLDEESRILAENILRKK